MEETDVYTVGGAGEEENTITAPHAPPTVFNLSEQTHKYLLVDLHGSWQRETHLPLKCRTEGGLRRPAFSDPTSP